MWFFDKGLKATVMSTELIMEANVSKKVLFQALHFAQEFEKKYSAYQVNSLLSKINASAGIKPIRCTHDELYIFQKAYEIAELSQGIFDPTIGSLTQGLYGFGKSKTYIPTQKEIQKSKKLVNYKKIKLNDDTIYLEEKGMRLDLGGIGKGYAADKIIEILLQNQASKAFVSVGGEIVSIGKEHKFAIQDPFNKQNIIAVIKTSKKPISMATSGDYERFIKSQEHHHIFNALTNQQNHYYTSITLFKNGIVATELDALTTIVYNTPIDKLKEMSQQFQITIVAITHSKQIIFENYIDINLKSIEFFTFKHLD